MTNHKASEFNSVPVFALLAALALAWPFLGCTDSKKSATTEVSAKVEKTKKIVKPSSDRPEDQFLYRQMTALESGHQVVVESLQFFAKAIPNCAEVNAKNRPTAQNIEHSLLNELAFAIRSHWSAEKGQFVSVAERQGYSTVLEWARDRQGAVGELTVRRRMQNRDQVLARLVATGASSARWELVHQAFRSSYEVALGPNQTMNCDVKSDSEWKLIELRCHNVGHAARVGRDLETVVLPTLEYSRHGETTLAGTGTQYRNNRALCKDDKPVAFKAPRNQTFITLYMNFDKEKPVEAKPQVAVAQTQPPPLAAAAPADTAVVLGAQIAIGAGQNAVASPAQVGSVTAKPKVRASLDGSEMPENEFAEAALSRLGQDSPAGEILKSQGALETMKTEALHEKVEPAPGTVEFLDPNDLGRSAELR